MNNTFQQNTVNAIVFKLQSIYSPLRTGEQHVSRKYSKCNSFQVTPNLLKSENIKVDIAQLCNELQFCNFTMQ